MKTKKLKIGVKDIAQAARRDYRSCLRDKARGDYAMTLDSIARYIVSRLLRSP